MTIDRKELIKQRYEVEKISCANIARELGVSRQRVSRLVKNMGLTSPVRVARLKRIEAIPHFLKTGATDKQIADALGVPVHVVEYAVAKHPERKKLVVARRNNKASSKRRALIPGLIKQGMTGPEMALHLGVPKTTIASDLVAITLPKSIVAMQKANSKRARMEGRAASREQAQGRAN